MLGIGFPPWTGGVVQYVEGFPGGPAGFVARADALADRYGERFRVPESLRREPRRRHLRPERRAGGIRLKLRPLRSSTRQEVQLRTK